MVVKYCISVLCIWSLSLAQNQLHISGTVINGRTTLPVSGAAVQLTRLTVGEKTDSAGYFSLVGTSGIQKYGKPPGVRPTKSTITIPFRHEMEGPVVIRILDLTGKERTSVFSGRLASGIWNVTPPQLMPGVCICTFTSPQSQNSIRFISSIETPGKVSGVLPGNPFISDLQISGLAKITIDQPIDTLVVTKSGYRTARIPISTYQQNGLNIVLEDSSITEENTTYLPDPSWPCYMPDGIPPPALGEVAFTITFQIGAIHNVGLTQFGQRRQYDINGGTITGNRITGTVLTGGLDYELTLSNGSTEVEQINIFRANNIPILMRNAGVSPTGIKNVRMVLDFEAPTSSSFSWLNTGKFAATRSVDTAAKTIRLEVYDISKVALTTIKTQIKDPSGLPSQTWECFQSTGTQGTTVFTENVTLGTSISIGASKRGNRNIIPITGGTTTGRIVGKILNGGADYQLSGLDARYTLAPNDGEFILVRNCGEGGLVPAFEARLAGPYAFLNENKYLSSSPNVGGGGVSITFYEKK